MGRISARVGMSRIFYIDIGWISLVACLDQTPFLKNVLVQDSVIDVKLTMKEKCRKKKGVRKVK